MWWRYRAFHSRSMASEVKPMEKISEELGEIIDEEMAACMQQRI